MVRTEHQFLVRIILFQEGSVVLGRLVEAEAEADMVQREVMVPTVKSPILTRVRYRHIELAVEGAEEEPLEGMGAMEQTVPRMDSAE